MIDFKLDIDAFEHFLKAGSGLLAPPPQLLISSHNTGHLTIESSVSQDGCGTPVAQYLVPEPDQVPAPGSVARRAGLQVDGGPPRTIQLQAEHLVPRTGEKFQLTGALRKHAGAVQRGPRFDAHGAVLGRGQVGFEGDPQSLTRVGPPHRAVRAA